MASSPRASPPEKDAQQLLSDTMEDFEHFFANFETYRKKYGGEYVAIRDKRVAVHDSAIEAVRFKLEEWDLDPAEVVIQFVPERDMALVL